jgi:autotransporter-associated beta strand protein
MKTDLSIHSYRFAAALALLTAIFQPLSSEAANLIWNTTNASWSSNGSWTPSQQPGSGDSVFFNVSSSSEYTSTLGANYTIFQLTANGTAGTGNLTIAPGGNNILTLSASDGGASPSAIQINAGAGPVSIQAALRLDKNDGEDNIISVENAGGLTLTQFATGTGGFTKEGNGTLYLNLSGNNTIGDSSTIEGGTVELASGNLLQNGFLGIANSSGSNATLNIQSGSMEVSNSSRIGLEGSGTVNVNGGNLTLANQVDIGPTNSSESGTAVVNLNAGNLRQTGQGTTMMIGGAAGSGELNIAGGNFSVSGQFLITQNGKLNVSGGNTIIGNPSDSNYGISVSGSNASFSLTGGTIAAGNVRLSGGAAFNLGTGTTAGSADILSIATFQNDYGKLNLNHSSEIILDATIVNNIAINQIGSGTTTLTGYISAQENATISSGTLAFNTTSSIISLPSITNNSALVFAGSNKAIFFGPISGIGSVSQNSSGMTLLGGNNTFSGQTLVKSGTLSLLKPQALYNGTASDWTSANIKVESGATLAFGIGNATTFSPAQVSTLLSGLLSGANATGGFQSGSFVGFNTADANDTPYQFNVSTEMDISITDSSAGAVGLAKIGNGWLTLNAASTYTGDTRVTGGWLTLGSEGSLLSSGNLVVSGATFGVDAANPGQSFATISISDGGSLHGGSIVNFTNSATISSGTLTGEIGGSGFLVKTGNGSALVAGNLTHSGGTTIESGTLKIGTAITGSISGDVAVLQNGTIEFNRGDADSNSVTFSGTGAITKVGNGTLTFDGESSGFEGATTISAGTLQIGSGGATGSLGGAITANAGTALVYNTSVNVVLGALSGNGSLVQAGNGSLIVSTNQTEFTGATRIQSGTLQIGNGGASGSLTGNITNNGTLVLNRSDDFTFSANSTGTGTLFKLGSNTVTLNRTQSNTGGTVIDSGTLVLSSNNLLAATGNLSVNNGAAFGLGSNNQTLSTVILNGGDITGTGTLSANSGFAVQGGSFSARLGGNGSLVKSGTSSFALTGNNTYGGKTVVQDGVVSFDTAGANRTSAQSLGTNASVDLGVALSTSGTLSYTGAAGTFAKHINALGSGNNTVMNSGGGLLTLTGNITKNGTVLILVGGTGGIQINGAISGSAENSDLVLNGGNITLNATNTYNGPTFLNNGASLTLAVANALPGDLIIDASSSVAFGANQTMEALSGAAGSTINIGSYTLTMGSNGTDSLFEGTIAGTSGKVVKTGSNAITLVGANTYNGSTTISGGVLVFGTPASLYNGNNSSWTGDKIIVNNGGAFALAIGSGALFTQEQADEIFQTLSSNATAGGILAGGSFGWDFEGELTANQSVVTDRQGGGAIGFVKLGNGTLIIDGNQTYTGPTAIRGGTMALASSDLLVATGNLTVQGGTLALGSNNQTFNNVTLASGVIGGNGTLTAANYAVQSGSATANLVGNATLQKTTAGSAVLSGNNAYTGNTTISGGMLTFLNASSLYGGNATRWNSGNISAASGSTVAFGVGADGGFSAGNITTLFTNLTQNQTTAGGIQAGANFGIDTNGSNASVSNAFKNRTGTGNGTLALVKLGEGTLTLTGNNTHTGGTFIQSGTLTGDSLGIKGNITNNGTLLFGGGSYQTEITGSGALLVAGIANLVGNATMAGGTMIQSGNLTIGGRNSNGAYIAGSISGDITNNDTLTFDMDSANRTYSGVISGNGKVVTSSVSGTTGKLYLTGNNTYTGGTFVKTGTLDISGGSLASTGNVSVTGRAFSIGASNQTVGDFKLAGSSTTNVTGTGTLTASRFDLRAGNVSLSLAGTAAIEKNLLVDGRNYGVSYDNDIVYLSGNNTSIGNVTVSGGILSFDTVQSLYSGNSSFWTPDKITVRSDEYNPFTATLALGTGNGSATSGFSDAQIGEISLNLTRNGTGGLTANSSIGLNVASGNFTLNSTITDRADGGSIGMDKIGNGTLVLGSSNTFSGNFNVFEGTVRAGTHNALFANSSLVLEVKNTEKTSAYDFGNYNQQLVDVTLLSGNLTGGTGIVSASGNYTMYSGNATANLSGSANLFKTNTNGSQSLNSISENVFLSGNNSYTGQTVVTGVQWTQDLGQKYGILTSTPTPHNARLQFETPGSLYGGNVTMWTPENIEVANYGILSLRAGAGGFNGTQVDTFIQNTITANRSSGGFLDKSVLGIDTNGGDITVTANIIDFTALSGSMGLIKYGNGTLTLTGNNSYSLSTSITGGTLALGQNANLSSASADLLVSNSTLNIGQTSQSVGIITVENGSILGDGSLTATQAYSSNFEYELYKNVGFVFSNSTIAPSLSGNGKMYIASGNVTLSGNNTHTGNTTMGFATLNLANVNAVSASTLVVTGTVNLTAPGGANTYNLGGLSGSTGLSIGNNALRIGANGMNTTYSGFLGGISGNGSVTKVGNGTLILSSNNTYTGGTTISGGTLQLGAGSTTGSVTGNIINNANLTFNRLGNFSQTEIISGNGNVTKQGTGNLTLSGSQTYSGSTTVSEGTLTLSGSLASTSIGIASGATLLNQNSGLLANSTVANAGNFTVNAAETIGSLTGSGNTILNAALTTGGLNNADQISGNITGNASLTKAGNGTLSLTGSATNSGGLMISSGTLSIGNGNTTGSVTGNITNNAALVFNRSNENTYNGIVSGNGTLEQLGTGTTILGGNNTYTGGTIVTGGILQGTTQSLQGAITNNATLVFYQTANGTYAGALGGTGLLSKNGTGTLIVSGNGSFSGATAINSGTLAVTGSLANATTQINSGATLTGSGSLGAVTINSGGILTGTGTAGAVTINAGGSINPGNSPGTITVGNSVWNGGGIYNWELDSVNGKEGTGWDLISSSGNLTINASSGDEFVINATNGNGSGFNPNTRSYNWKIAEFTGGITGFDASKFVIDSTDFNLAPTDGIFLLSVASTNTTLSLNYSTVATWQAGSGNWTTTANWVEGIAPIDGVRIEYAGDTGDSENNSTVANIKGLTFTNSSNGSFTIGGGDLVIGSEGIVNNSTHTNTVAINLTLGADQTFAANTGNLVVSGDISGEASLTKEGNKTLVLSGNNTYAGTTTVNNGTLEIATGGSINNTSDIFVGLLDGDNGTLHINGGSLSNAVGNLGTQEGSVGTAIVSAGNWTNTGSLFVGLGGTGSLTINGTGHVTNEDGFVGHFFGSTGTVGVSGGTWTNRYLFIGNDGTGSLTINGTGNVTNSDGYVGHLGGGNGTVSVSGGTWTNSSNLDIGGAEGTGSLTINGTGTVIVGGTLSRSSHGTINLESGGTLQIGNGGTTGMLATDLTNNGTLVFDVADVAYHDNSINGTGAVDKTGTGTLVLSGSSSNYSGATSIKAGTLLLDSGYSNTASAVSVLSNGTLGGSGTAGDVTVLANATMSPGGNAPVGISTFSISSVNPEIATLTVGNLTFNGGAIYNWQLGNATGMAGTDWDLISSLGTLGLNATSSNLTLSLSTFGDATLEGVKKASWEIGNSTQSITGFNKNAFSINYNSMNGTDGRYFMSLGSGNKTLVLNYKTAATWNTGNGNWTTASQWENDFLPENGDAVEFTGTGGISTNNFASGNLSTISGISFLEGAGAYTVNGNTLQIGEDGIVNASSNLQTIGMNLTAGEVLVVDAANEGIEISGVVSGSSSLTKTGSKTLTLSGNNTYSGGTSVDAGTLYLRTDIFAPEGALFNMGNVSVASGATLRSERGNLLGNLVLNGGTWVDDNGFGGSLAGSVELGATSTFQAEYSQTVTANITGTGGLVKSGQGILTLSGNNTYTGGTVINTGTLSVTGNVSGTEGVSIKSGTLAVQAGGLLLTGTGGSLSVGDASGDNGTLQISGGSLASATANIGNAFRSNGTANMSAGIWTTQSRLSVGFGGNGVLNLSGGFVSNDEGFVGNQDGSTGVVNMSNGTWTNNSFLDIGGSGTGTLNLSGGSITASTGSIAKYTNSTGIANITGGSWFNNNSFSVGDMGTGTLNLYGGILSVGTNGTGTVNLAKTAGSSGTMNWGNGNSVGSLLAGGITGGGGSAVVNLNFTGNSTIGAVLSGGLSLNQIGTGISILTANNTHNGGTTVSSGTLWTKNSQALGTGNVLVNGGALLTTSSQESIMGNQTLSIGGNLDWTSGKIAFYDTGTSPLSGNLTINVGGNFTTSAGSKTFDFSGVEALNSGDYTLVSTVGLVNATGVNFVAAHGLYTTLYGNFTTTNKTVVYTVTGATSGGTDIRNNGGPNTPIIANYNITGPTVTIGEINQVNALTFSSSAPLAIQSNGELIVTSGTLAVQTGSSVVSGGTLVAPEGLNKDGTGELDFTNNVVVTGTAAVNAGLLSVNGQLQATGGVVVNPNATLGGAGLIVGNVNINGGNLSPGNSPGTLSVAGNLVLTGANSTLIEIESPTNFDRIVVSGTATLGGTLNAVAYEGGIITPGARYDFLQAGSIAGEFDSLVAPEGLRVRLLNSGTVGTLLFGPGSYVPMAINQNQRNVAKALDTFIVATDGDQQTVSIALDSLTTEQFPSAFDQIMPGFYESLADMAIEQAFNQTQMLNQRISSVRLGAAGFQAIGGISQPLVHDKNGKSAADAKDASPIVESATATNWNAWALGTGMFSRTTNLGSLQNYNNDAGGFLVGADYRWSENFVTGLYGGYDYSYAEYSGGGSTKGNSFSFGTYASYAKDGYYADAVIGGGYTGFQTQRSIEFSTIDRTASADPNSGQFTAGLNLGKDFEVGKFTLGPIVGAQYTYAGIGSFTESGADSLDLSLGQQNANSLRSTLGGRIAYTWNLNQKIALIPEVRMFWQHEFLNNARNINASLDGGNGASFDYETTDPYRNSVFAGAGVTAQFGKNLSGSLFYNINFGSQTYQSNMVSAGLNLSF